jgi:hypothetical protein
MMDLDLLTKLHLSSLPMSYQPSSFNAPIFLGAFQLGGQQIPVGELRGLSQKVSWIRDFRYSLIQLGDEKEKKPTHSL